MSWYRSRITNRLRAAEQPLQPYDLAAQGGEWAPISDQEAAADTHYIRTKAGAIHSVPLSDLPAALAVGGTELTADEAKVADPRLFGAADPALYRPEGTSRFRANREAAPQ